MERILVAEQRGSGNDRIGIELQHAFDPLTNNDGAILHRSMMLPHRPAV